MKYPGVADGRETGAPNARDVRVLGWGVEGSRQYFDLKCRHKAFSRELPDAVFVIETSPGCFDSRSLMSALAQHDRS